MCRFSLQLMFMWVSSFDFINSNTYSPFFYTGSKIFENCLVNKLKGKTRLLVTHQLQYLRGVDKIFVLQGGTITESGSYDELMTQDGEFARLVKNFTHEKEKEESKEKEEKPEETKKEAKKPQENKIMSVEEREVGKLDQKVYLDYITSIGGTLLVSLILLVMIFESGTKVGSDFWLSYWSGDTALDKHGVSFYLGVYAAWGVANFVLVFARQKPQKPFQINHLITLSFLKQGVVHHLRFDQRC